ncbi:hypothetical protein MTF64_15460 [Pseudoalteromonas sp. 2CM41L]|uniref:hypothetical protein n=1 Tax=unclassified Pseudoalteromonas TaxID=194690 RepID=UPI0020C17ED5|nr:MULTISPECIES: hypothetical protein [unclassified Pseudoalteromonas]MCK8108280.1 hypothetical protein [Pseudoalteromonas sp. 2CM41L]MCK8131405.1 hypothetical protein [Pseudoalteromonas sp. 2CM28B]
MTINKFILITITVIWQGTLFLLVGRLYRIWLLKDKLPELFDSSSLSNLMEKSKDIDTITLILKFKQQEKDTLQQLFMNQLNAQIEIMLLLLGGILLGITVHVWFHIRNREPYK